MKGTLDRGLILDPRDDFTLECCPDSDFAGLWGYEDANDPHCVRSRAGWVITLAGCPIVWSSRLIQLICLSSMESEYVSMSMAMKELLPAIDLVHELGGCLGVPIQDITNIHVRVHEDNVGALTLGKLEPRRMTPRSKHYVCRYHWFRSQIAPHGDRSIELVKISTTDQLGDLFTKGLVRVPFKHLRKKLMGW